MEHKYSQSGYDTKYQERRLIYYMGPEVPRFSEEPDKPDLDKLKTEMEKKKEEEQKRNKERVRALDDAVHDSIRKEGRRIYKDEAEIKKAIEDFTKKYLIQYEGLKTEEDVRKDIAWYVLHNVRNFEMDGMDQVKPRYSFDEKGKIKFEGKVVLLQPTPENIRAQADQAVRFLLKNYEGSKSLSRDLYPRTIMPIGSFRLLNERQQLAAATRALELFKEKNPKMFEVSAGALGSTPYKAELILINGRYVIPTDTGIETQGNRVVPDPEFLKKLRKKAEEEEK